jgi:hypothetical protein
MSAPRTDSACENFLYCYQAMNVATATAALQTTVSATSARSCPPYLENLAGGICQAVQRLAFVGIGSQRCFGVLKLLSQYLDGIGYGLPHLTSPIANAGPTAMYRMLSG